MKVPEGQAGCIPPRVLEMFKAAKGPRQKAIIVNSFVPKNTPYKGSIEWKGTKIERFIESYTSQTDTTEILGVTWTELRSSLGHGNLEAGAAAIEEGLANGDIKKRARCTFAGRSW